MTHRKIIFGEYDTWHRWGLTLTSWNLSAPSYKSSFVTVPGRDGDLDLTTALTDGEPRYANRTLSATFELSSGTRSARVATFSKIMNALDGRRVNIILPDDPTHYVTGRLQVAIEYNDLAHGALTVSGNCDPWRYATAEKEVSFETAGTATDAVLFNDGRRRLIPKVTVLGDGATITQGSKSWEVAPGSVVLPDLQLEEGANAITYTVDGVLTFSWREAIL